MIHTEQESHKKFLIFLWLHANFEVSVVSFGEDIPSHMNVSPEYWRGRKTEPEMWEPLAIKLKKNSKGKNVKREEY